MDNPQPIFILWTRSFWAFVAALVLVYEGGQLMTFAAPLAAVAEAWTGVPAATVLAQVELWAPFVAILFGMHQRSGAARPYTLDPRALK